MIMTFPPPQNASTVHRVVSCFLLRHTALPGAVVVPQVAVFHRQDTMPTFPGHWAPCSGTIEPGERPWQAADRELHEETNLPEDVRPRPQHGLYVDVEHVSRRDPANPVKRIIRVYPFSVEMCGHGGAAATAAGELELKGTEHDAFKFVTVEELEQLRPAVPALAEAFHRATFGRYLLPSNGTTAVGAEPPEERVVRAWASDLESGAAAMARKALQILDDLEQRGTITAAPVHDLAGRMIVMRPSMVAITNALARVLRGAAPRTVLEELEDQSRRAIGLAVEALLSIIRLQNQEQKQKNLSISRRVFRIATFSRSSTLVAVFRGLQRRINAEAGDLAQKVALEVSCSESMPGGEGRLMARDLVEGDMRVEARCFEDGALVRAAAAGAVDVVLVGADSVMPGESVVNKVGTAALLRAAASSGDDAAALALAGKKRAVTICCADRFKVWDDLFPPPLEDIFEVLPWDLLDRVLLPEPLLPA
mmetsp:Transcript_10213/g.25659  ORF Transcript_10213/g.25659 Transcript_10213/m.25659 type:complete len:479 (+) Transcript_10213:179-1615(+)